MLSAVSARRRDRARTVAAGGLAAMMLVTTGYGAYEAGQSARASVPASAASKPAPVVTKPKPTTAHPKPQSTPGPTSVFLTRNDGPGAPVVSPASRQSHRTPQPSPQPTTSPKPQPKPKPKPSPTPTCLPVTGTCLPPTITQVFAEWIH